MSWVTEFKIIYFFFMRIVFLLLITILFIPKLHSIEVSSLEAERRLKFNELFPKKVCDKIYKDIDFGLKNKLEEEIMVMAYHLSLIHI